MTRPNGYPHPARRQRTAPLVAALAIALCPAAPVSASSPTPAESGLTPEARAFLRHGQTFARDGQWQAAIALYKNALDINPRLADAHFLLGVAYHQHEEPDSAVSALRRAGQLNPRSARTFYNLGVAYAETGDMAKEMAAYRKALQLNPRHISSHYNLATAYWAQGKDGLACGKLYQAGRLYQETGHPDQARQMLGLIQRIQPSSAYRQQLAKVIEGR